MYYLRPPLAFGYLRISHDEIDQMFSIAAQEQDVMSYYHRHLGGNIPADVRFYGCYKDVAQSAYRGPKHELWQRPGGSELKKVLQTGDHIIFKRLDRCFRDGKDAQETIEWLAKHGITAHTEHGPLEVESAFGMFFFQFQANQAQLEGGIISERTKAGQRQRYLVERKAMARRRVFGWKRLTLDASRKEKHPWWKWVPWERDRKTGDIAAEARESGLTLKRTANLLNRMRRFNGPKKSKWTASSMMDFLAAREEGWPLPQDQIDGIYRGRMNIFKRTRHIEPLHAETQLDLSEIKNPAG